MRNQFENVDHGSPSILVDTVDASEAVTLVGKAYCEHRMRITGQRREFRALQTEVVLDDLAFHRLSYGADVSIEASPLTSWVLVSTPIRGSLILTRGSESRTLGPGESVAIDARRPFELEWKRQCALRTVRIPLRYIEDAAAELTGGVEDMPLRFGVEGPRSPADSRSWQALVEFAEREALQAGAFTTSSLIGSRIAQLIASAFVATHPVSTADSTTRREHGRLRPRHLRRAVDFIEAHAHEELTLPMIAAAAGAGARTVQLGFREHLGTTPMAHLQAVRMDRALRALMNADPAAGTTVAVVAHAWGFTNLGRFAVAYRKRFGEAPSHTLRR